MTPIDSLPVWFALPVALVLWGLWVLLVGADRRRAARRVALIIVLTQGAENRALDNRVRNDQGQHHADQIYRSSQQHVEGQRRSVHVVNHHPKLSARPAAPVRLAS